MFLKTEIMLIAEKLRPTCMTQFLRTLNSQWEKRWDRSGIIRRTPFKLFTQRISKYLFSGAVPIPLWVSCSTGGSRCGNFGNGSSPHGYSLCRDSTTPFAHSTAHWQVINCPQVDCLHMATFALIVAHLLCILLGSNPGWSWMAAHYTKHPRHNCSENHVSIICKHGINIGLRHNAHIILLLVKMFIDFLFTYNEKKYFTVDRMINESKNWNCTR